MDSLTDRMNVLRSARIMAGLRQDQLSDRAGVTREMIIRIERKDRSVPSGKLYDVQSALEKAGILFIAATDEHGMAIAVKKSEPPKAIAPILRGTTFLNSSIKGTNRLVAI